jgi:hypothetical protein
LDLKKVDMAIRDFFEFYSLYKDLSAENIIDRLIFEKTMTEIILFSKKYESSKYAKIKDKFYEELIRLKNEDNLHETLFKEHLGIGLEKLFSDLILGTMAVKNYVLFESLDQSACHPHPEGYHKLQSNFPSK